MAHRGVWYIGPRTIKRITKCFHVPRAAAARRDDTSSGDIHADDCIPTRGGSSTHSAENGLGNQDLWKPRLRYVGVLRRVEGRLAGLRKLSKTQLGMTSRRSPNGRGDIQLPEHDVAGG